MKAKEFYNLLKANEIEFYTGVPDSLLKNLCAYIADINPKGGEIISANEGGAIALASGYHLATGKLPVVYMQNSGLGNSINPLLSLTDKLVYSIPMLLVVGWRGEPGIKDEPQHLKQGLVTLDIFDVLKIKYEILNCDFDISKSIIQNLIDYAKNNNCPVALIVRKNTFDYYKRQNQVTTNFSMNREKAIKVILDNLPEDSIVVSTTGKTSRELFEYREAKKQGHKNDFLTVGSMGHANQIALGIALSAPDKKVFCLDGDGALLMHLGSMGIIGDLAPKNYCHILLNNGAHDSVGGQQTIGFTTNFSNIATSFNYKNSIKVASLRKLISAMNFITANEGPNFLEVLINKGARTNLGRPTLSPQNNKIDFMEQFK